MNKSDGSTNAPHRRNSVRAELRGEEARRSSAFLVMSRNRLLLLIVALLASHAAYANAQSLISGNADVSSSITAPSAQMDREYTRPSQSTRFANYLFEAYGPYPIAGAAFQGALAQWTNSPPEWGQGPDGFGRRAASKFGIEAVSATTRYGIAEMFKEDSLYYRCECSGLMPRARHAVLSTLTARRGDDGHGVFSIAALVAPYSGAMTAVYGWYPDRFSSKDAMRIGSYNLLYYVGGNLALEFINRGPHSILSRMHLNNPHGAPEEGIER